MSKPLSALVAVAVLALAACGGSSPASGSAAPPAATPAPGATATPAATDTAPSAGPVDNCVLLTAADLKTVIGAEFEAGVADSVGQCSWQGEPFVNLFVQDIRLEFIKSTFVGGEDATVSGHAAYWNPGPGLQSLWVDVGSGRTMILTFPKAEEVGAAELAIALALAEIAVGRM